MSEITSKFLLPTEDEAFALISKGRLPYAMARRTIVAERSRKNNYRTQTIRELHVAQENGTLEPPLPENIAKAVRALDLRLDVGIDESVTPRLDFDHRIADIVIEAAFEHGYRSDLNSGEKG